MSTWKDEHGLIWPNIHPHHKEAVEILYNKTYNKLLSEIKITNPEKEVEGYYRQSALRHLIKYYLMGLHVQETFPFEDRKVAREVYHELKKSIVCPTPLIREDKIPLLNNLFKKHSQQFKITPLGFTEVISIMLVVFNEVWDDCLDNWRFPYGKYEREVWYRNRHEVIQANFKFFDEKFLTGENTGLDYSEYKEKIGKAC